MSTRPINDETRRKAKAAAIKEACAEWSKCRKAFLREEVQRHYRVADLTGADKGLLVSMLLEAQFGRNYGQYLNDKAA